MIFHIFLFTYLLKSAHTFQHAQMFMIFIMAIIGKIATHSNTQNVKDQTNGWPPSCITYKSQSKSIVMSFDGVFLPLDYIFQ